jgi:hypothetical protein
MILCFLQSRKRQTFIWFVNMLMLSLPVNQIASAQSSASPKQGNIYHWAYAAAFGTGAYRVGGVDSLILRISPKIKVRSKDKHHVGLNLKLPITLGLESIQVDDILSEDINDQFKTFSFVPGVQLEWPVTSRWLLKPYGHYGWGTKLASEGTAWIYFAGLNSQFAFHSGKLTMNLLNGLQWFGYHPNRGDADRFSRIVTGLEGEYPLGGLTFKGHPLDIRPHIVHYWYVNDLDFQILSQYPVEINQELELAIAVGSKEPFTLWFFDFDRIGIGFITGNDLQGIRIIVSSVFD